MHAGVVTTLVRPEEEEHLLAMAKELQISLKKCEVPPLESTDTGMVKKSLEDIFKFMESDRRD